MTMPALGDFESIARRDLPGTTLAPSLLASLRAEIMGVISADMAEMRAEIERRETSRSVHRNANRIAVLVVAFAANLSIPLISNMIFHSAMLATYAPSVAVSLDLLVTAYALMRKY